MLKEIFKSKLHLVFRPKRFYFPTRVIFGEKKGGRLNEFYNAFEMVGIFFFILIGVDADSTWKGFSLFFHYFFVLINRNYFSISEIWERVFFSSNF